MANQMLEESSEERDLGVIIDESLKFHRHATVAVKKANTVLGIIKKKFYYSGHTNITVIVQVYGEASSRIRERNLGPTL